MVGRGQRPERAERGAKELKHYLSFDKGEEFEAPCVVLAELPSLRGLWPLVAGSAIQRQSLAVGSL